jgi:O-antigen ligase
MWNGRVRQALPVTPPSGGAWRDPRRPRWHVSPYLWTLVLVPIALVLGLASGLRPELTIAATLSAVFLTLMLWNLAFGLAVLILLGFFEQFSQLAGSVSLAKGGGALLTLAWLAKMAVASPEERESHDIFNRYPWLAGALVLLVAWAATSAVWATSSSAAAHATGRYAFNFVLFPLAFAALDKREHVVWLFVAFVVGAVLSAGYGLVIAPNHNPRTIGRLSGAGLHPNELGGLLVVAIVLATALAAVREWHKVFRAAAFGAAVACAAGLYLTESRGALFLGLGTALLVAPLFAGRGRRAAAAILAILAIVLSVGWFEFAASSNTRHRILHPETRGGEGRADLWRVGERMVVAHPLFGVGAGNFRVRSVDFLLRPGATVDAQYVVDRPLVPHNIYLNVLTELGIVGLALFLFILATVLRCVLEAAHVFARRGDPTMELLARALFIGLVALLVADSVSSQLYNKELWLLLALAPAVRALADRLPHPVASQHLVRTAARPSAVGFR